jgi:hypothetical protein
LISIFSTKANIMFDGYKPTLKERVISAIGALSDAQEHNKRNEPESVISCVNDCKEILLNLGREISALDHWIDQQRAEIDRESRPGATYGDTDHDQAAVHYGQLEILSDLERYLSK